MMPQDCQYTMRIINADGSEAEMCGNGIRCLALFIQEQEQSKKPSGDAATGTVSYSIFTLAGKIVTEVSANLVFFSEVPDVYRISFLVLCPDCPVVDIARRPGQCGHGQASTVPLEHSLAPVSSALLLTLRRQ